MNRFLVVPFLFFSMSATAKVHDMSTVMSKMTSAEKQELGKVLEQIQMKTIKDPQSGAVRMEVTRVEKGSVYDREGVKVGDFFVSENSSQPGQAMELTSKINSTAPAEKTKPASR